jgi:hypothetical protein
MLGQFLYRRISQMTGCPIEIVRTILAFNFFCTRSWWKAWTYTLLDAWKHRAR